MRAMCTQPAQVRAERIGFVFAEEALRSGWLSP